MASTSGSGGDDKNPIHSGGDKNPIMGRRIDQGFLVALWELIYQALGFNVPQNRAPVDAAGFFPNKPPLHPNTLSAHRMAIAPNTMAGNPAEPPKKRLRVDGVQAKAPSFRRKAVKTPFPSVRGRVRPELYEGTMRQVLHYEVQNYLQGLAGAEAPASPKGLAGAEAPASWNLRQYLPFMVHHSGEVRPARRLTRRVQQAVWRYFIDVARAERPDLVVPPQELQEYLQEFVTQVAENFHNAVARTVLDDMYDDDPECTDDSDDADDPDDPDGGDNAAGCPMAIGV